MGQPEILVVEDDADIATILDHVLSREQFKATVASTGEEALVALRESVPDLVLLDLMLPDMSGLEVLKYLRRTRHHQGVPVVVLTAKKNEADRILGLELGADDYVTKPFSPRELVLRVRAALAHAPVTTPPQGSDHHLRLGPIEIDVEQYRVYVEDRSVELTRTEFKLLSELVRARGRVKSREGLLSDVWGYDSGVLTRTVDTHVRRLRGKLGSAAHWLTTVRGVGYRIHSPGLEAN